MIERNYFTIEISWRAIKIAVVTLISILVIFGAITIARGSVGISTKMSASVAGWFKTYRIDNENLSITTNMTVWVNGTQFVKCEGNKDLVNNELGLSF